jgi:flagellar protein FlaG
MTTPISLPTGDILPFVANTPASSARAADPQGQGRSAPDSANDPSQVSAQAAGKADGKAGKGDLPGAAKGPVQTRLTIEEIGNTGRFIYKFLNPVTGEVVQQLPREQLLKLGETDAYASGAMLNAQV